MEQAILTLQIEQNLYARQGKAISNFKATLPEQQALLAQQMLKDPYNFNFLTLEPKVQELQLEKELTEHITKFLLDLGKGCLYRKAIQDRDWYKRIFYRPALLSYTPSLFRGY